MSDQLTELLRERLADHEMDVPEGAWEHVSGHLAASASGESLREALQEKFSGHEVEVDPSAWTQISAQLGHGAAAGTAVGSGWIAAGVAAVAVTIGVLWWSSPDAVTGPAIAETPIAVLNETPPEGAPAASGTTSPEPMPVEEQLVEEPVAEPLPTSPAGVPEASTGTAEVQSPTTPAQASSPAPEVSSPSVPGTQGTPHVEPAPETPQPDRSTGDAVPAHAQDDHAAPQVQQQAVPEPNVGEDGHDDNAPAEVSSPEDVPQEDPFQTDRNSDIFIPNAFTPQGDGVNDKFKISAPEHEKVDVRVFAAKSGSLVFRSNDLDHMWDGRLPNGNIAEEGFYSCVVLLTDKSGQTRVKRVVVQLFR